MKEVIYQFCREHSPLSLFEHLRIISRRDGEDFVFRDLVSVLPEAEKEWAFSNEMGLHIGIEKIGNPYAVIYAPNPLFEDWFTKLKAEGYTGKTILLHTGRLIGGIDMFKMFGSKADYSFQEPTDDLAAKLYEVLKK